MKLFKLFSLLILAALITGCGDDELPDYFKLDRLRVLALTLDTPEVAPGSSVDLTAVVSDATGGGRALTYALEGCVDPGVGYGAEPTCIGNPTRTVISAGAIGNGNAGNDYTAAEAAITVNVPAAGVIFTDPRTGAARSAADQYNGVAYLLVYTVTATLTGEKEMAFRRVVVSTKPAKNSNPAITQLNYNGANITGAALSPSAVPLRLVAATSQIESYSELQTNGTLETKNEELLVTWFVTSGEVKRSRTDINTDNTYTPAQPLPGQVTFVGVLRDNRGGSSFVIDQL